MASYTQHNDQPRVMTPLGLAPAAYAKKTGMKTALAVYMGIARFADNETGRSSCTVAQVAEYLGLGTTQVGEAVGWLLKNRWITRLIEGRKGSGASLYVVHMAPQTSAEPVVEEGQDEAERDEEGQHPEIRGLNDSAPGNPGTDTGSAPGNPGVSTRKPGDFLVSSLLLTTTTSVTDSVGDDKVGKTLPLLGLIHEAPMPKAPKRRTASRPESTGETEYPPEFEAWWLAYPVCVKGKARTRGSKSKAFSIFQRLIREGRLTLDQLMALAKVYSEDITPDRVAYVMHATTFLNGRWEDYAEAAGRAVSGELTNEEIVALIGEDRDPLAPLPEGVSGLSAQGRQIREQQRQQRQADRLAKALARKKMQTEVPRQDEIRSSA